MSESGFHVGKTLSVCLSVCLSLSLSPSVRLDASLSHTPLRPRAGHVQPEWLDAAGEGCFSLILNNDNGKSGSTLTGSFPFAMHFLILK